MAKDPVCGMDIDPKTAAGKSEYKGQTYYFARWAAKKAFDKEPQKYVGHESRSALWGITKHNSGQVLLSIQRLVPFPRSHTLRM